MENELEFLREFYRLYCEKVIQGELVYPPKREKLLRNLRVYDKLKPIEDKLNEDLRALKEEFKDDADYHIGGINSMNRFWTGKQDDSIQLVAFGTLHTPEQIQRYLEGKINHQPLQYTPQNL